MTRNISLIIIAAAASSLLQCKAAEAANQPAEHAVLARILSQPDGLRFPDSPALADVPRPAELVGIISRQWKALEDDQDREKLVRFVSYMRLESDVTNILVAALDDPSPRVRETATVKLEQNYSDVVIRQLGPAILNAVKARTNTDAIQLLGRTGLEEAAQLLASEQAYASCSQRSVQLALARLGDKAAAKPFVSEYQSANAEEKFRLASDLGYIASDEACRALAQDLRNPAIITIGTMYSIRVPIITALRMANPGEPVLQPPPGDPKQRAIGVSVDDSYFERIEKWAQAKYGVTWDEPRPEPFWSMPRPGRGSDPIAPPPPRELGTQGK